MVRGLFLAAGLRFDLAVGQQIGGFGAQQEVVDADAVILVPRASLIIPETIVSAARCPCAEGFGETKIQNAAEGTAALG